MRTLLTLIAMALGTLFWAGCLEDIVCRSGPYFGELRVKVTINEENPEVPVTIFKGRFEKRDTLISELIDESTVFYDLEGDFYYSAAVLYQDGARQILAIDGKRMEVSDDNDGCPTVDDITLRLGLAD